MYCVRTVTDNLYWVGANDHRTHLFENIHPIPRGVSYNAYLLMDKSTVLFDTVDWSVCRQLMENLDHLLGDRPLDYLVINHMEPDHGASIEEILIRWPNVKIISTAKAFMLMRQFGFTVDNQELIEVKEGDTFSFGSHTVTFIAAPMVHWPEAMVTFDTTNGVLFSADAFGSFRSLDGKLFADEFDFDREWIDDARRYYTNIVGKYGAQVQALLKKAAALDIAMICPLHGPILRENLGYYLEKYQTWSSYEPEETGIVIAYASIHGNTAKAAKELAEMLKEKTEAPVKVYDLARADMPTVVAEAFRYDRLVLAAASYDGGVFPCMEDFLHHLRAKTYRSRKVALLENGTWAPSAARTMRGILDEMKNLTICEPVVTIRSTMKEADKEAMKELAEAILAV